MNEWMNRWMDGWWINENKKIKILPFSVAVSTPAGLGRGSYKYGGVRVENEHTWRSVIFSSSYRNGDECNSHIMESIRP